jgi:putative tryptophan/tyrosine transport system substrate-binding protein
MSLSSGDEVPRIIRALSLRYAVPAVYQFQKFTAAGGLVSYDEAEFYRLIGNYTGRVLRGEKPADLPVVQAAKFPHSLFFAKLSLTSPYSRLRLFDVIVGRASGTGRLLQLFAGRRC